MISNHTTDTIQILQEPGSQWLPLPLKKTLKDGGPIYQASFGHYMIFYVQNGDTTTNLFAFDIRDNSIQDANGNGEFVLANHCGFTFTKYKDDQILKYGIQYQRGIGPTALIERITIKSFRRTTSS